MSLMLLNEEAKRKWFGDRMAKGLSFRFIKGNVSGGTYSDDTTEKDRNVEVVCVETNERFKLLWG